MSVNITHTQSTTTSLTRLDLTRTVRSYHCEQHCVTLAGYGTVSVGMRRLLVFSVLLCCATVACANAAASTPNFNETLLIRPQLDGKVLLSWEFTVSESAGIGQTGRHFTLFPKSLGQVLQQYQIHQFSLSLAAGRWLTEEFGYESWRMPTDSTTIPNNHTIHPTTTYATHSLTPIPNPHHAPHGAELWAVLGEQEPEPSMGEEHLPIPKRHLNHTAGDQTTASIRSSVDLRWKKFQASLSGLFCASLTQMTSQSQSAPYELYSDRFSNRDLFRYSILPRESVCTENLSPFTKMLPCRGERGLGALLDPIKLYSAQYHSIQIKVLPIYDSAGQLDGWTLTQSLTVLFDPLLSIGRPDWSMNELLAAGPICSCPLSKYASLHLHLSAAFQAQLNLSKPFPVGLLSPNSHYTTEYAASTDIVHSYDLKRLSYPSSDLAISESCPRGGIDLQLRFQPPVNDTYLRRPLSQLNLTGPYERPIQIQRYLSASTLYSGTLFIHFHNPSMTDSYELKYFDALPWFCQVYLSSIRITLENSELVTQYYTPAQWRSYPSQFYFSFVIRSGGNISIAIQFDKAILTANEYPPDVSRGFDIGSGMIQLRCLSSPHADTIHYYTSNGLLVLLPFPDFSMPFNVIAFTSTVLAFFFGSLFNMTYSNTRELLKRIVKQQEEAEATTPIQRIKLKLAELFKRRPVTNPIDHSSSMIHLTTPAPLLERGHRQ